MAAANTERSARHMPDYRVGNGNRERNGLGKEDEEEERRASEFDRQATDRGFKRAKQSWG